MPSFKIVENTPIIKWKHNSGIVAILRTILQDGEWHSLHELRANIDVQHCIPPWLAVRSYQRSYPKIRAMNPEDRPDLAYQIYKGYRTFLADSSRSVKDFELRGRGFGREIRLRTVASMSLKQK